MPPITGSSHSTRKNTSRISLIAAGESMPLNISSTLIAICTGLIVAAQEGGTLSVFSVDEKTGELAPKGEPVPFAKPMGVVFLK